MSEKQKNKKLIIIVAVVFVVVVGITAGVIAMIAGQESVDDILALGDKYMTELDYESAIREYKRAIEVDPMRAEAYLKLADAYLEIGDRNSAISTLENGYDVTGDGRILERLNELRDEDNSNNDGTADTETVLLNANGGSVSADSKKVMVGEPYGELPTPTRDGYTFKGWFTEETGGTEITESTPVTATSEQTLYAQWGANRYTVTFDANGGSVTPSTAMVTYDSTYGNLPSPTREGYTFNGWFTAATGGEEITSASKVTTTSDQTFYAQWTAETEGPETGNPEPEPPTTGNPEPDPPKTGNPGPEPPATGNPEPEPTTTDTPEPEPPKTVTVTFNANGGSVSPTSMTVTYDAFYGDLPIPTREGYTFEGWYTAMTDGAEITESTQVTVVSEQTLYAQWKANSYTITFDANGGSLSSRKTTVQYDSTYGTLPTPTRKGYTFNGWYTEETGGTLITESTPMTVASAQTLYAMWNANTYTVTLDANGGTVTPSFVKMTYDSTCGELPIPTRDGYIFTGWFDSATGGKQIKSTFTVHITSDQTLYAHWVEFVQDESTVMMSSGQTITGSFPISNLDGMASMYRTWDVFFTVVVQEPGTLTLRFNIPESTVSMGNLIVEINNESTKGVDYGLGGGENTVTYQCKDVGIYRFKLSHYVAPAVSIDKNLDITLSFMADNPIENRALALPIQKKMEYCFIF